jgi:hypothetical protein
MNKRDAREAGVETGFGIGLDMENKPDFEDEFISDVLEIEDNARQFSPFEFFAHDMNEDENRADGLWEEYDKGLVIGAKRAFQYSD